MQTSSARRRRQYSDALRAVARARSQPAAASGGAKNAAEDTSTSRAIAAAIQAHGACGHLRARAASIRMRLRDRKRELERARAFG